MTTTPPPPPPPPRKESLGRLAGRLFGLGLIPIAVFCAVFVFMRAALGTAIEMQAWIFVTALAASVISVAALSRLAARAVVGEVEAVSEELITISADSI